MARFSVALVVALATTLVATACSGKGNPAAPSPTTPMTSFLTVRLESSQPIGGVSVVITGPIQQSQTTSAPGNVMFSDIASGVYTVTASGSGIAPASQTVQVDQSQSEQVTFQLAPMGTPWSALPPISDAAKAIVRTNLEMPGSENGITKRFSDGPIPVYADERFNSNNVVAGLNLWTEKTNGAVKFRVVSTPTEAESGITLSHNWPPPYPVPENICGSATRQIRGGLILSASAYFPFTVNGQPCDERLSVAHDVGHMLGWPQHTPPNTDVLSSAQLVWDVFPPQAQATEWLYRVPNGTRPE